MKPITILLLLGIYLPLFALSTDTSDDFLELIPSTSTMSIDTPESQTLVTKFETRRLKEGIEITREADEQDKVEYFPFQ